MLIINADDWGMNEKMTDRILTCYRHRRIHTVSAMAFMADSERAASLAKEFKMAVGLHLNLTQEFTGGTISATLRDHHQAVSVYLKARKINQILFNPFLRHSFDYVFRAQWEEFLRLYGYQPTRLDGHHHMHLCMNMLIMNRYPRGLRMRRNFSFDKKEKGPVNRFYRRLVDHWLKAHFSCPDFFFSMAPIDQERLRRITMLSTSADVELMVHPGVESEYKYLLSDEWLSLLSES